MKNTFKTLFALTLLCSVAFIFSSCNSNPTFGLEEISFEEIAKADLYDEYNYTTETNTYDPANGDRLTHKVFTGTNTGEQVRSTAASWKLEIEAGKLFKLHSGRVCADKKYRKIVIYMYTYDDEKLTSEVIATFTKK